MEAPRALYENFLLLGAAHGVFLAVALSLVRSGNRVALRLLALLTGAFAVDLGINYLNVSGALQHFPRLIFVESAAAFLYGPLLYLYVRALTAGKAWRFSSSQQLHLLPFALSLVLMIPMLRLPDAALVQMIYSGQDVGEHLDRWSFVPWVLAAMPRLLIGTYLVLGYARLIQHQRDIRDQFSWIESISLNWLRHLHIAIGVLWVLYFVALAYGGRGPVEEVLNIAIVVVVYLLGYLGLRQPEIFTRRSRERPAETGSAAPRPKYEKSALDAESAKVLFEELQKVMVEDQPYLDRKLTLSQLAEHLGLTPNYLSQVINQQTESNFFEFINGFRVEAAKKMLSDPSQARKSVLSVALESGFNSKSSFYSAFKNHTGVTPTHYRQSGMS